MKIHHVAIGVRDLEVAQAFYERHFGMTEHLRFRRDDLNLSGVMLEVGGTILELLCSDDPVDNTDDQHDFRTLGLKHIAIEVDDIDAKAQQLRDDGIDVPEPLQGKTTRIVFFKDPFGTTLELYERRADLCSK